MSRQHTQKQPTSQIVVITVNNRYLSEINRRGVIVTTPNVVQAKLYYQNGGLFHETRKNLEARQRTFEVLPVTIGGVS